MSRVLGVPIEEFFRTGGNLPETWDEEFVLCPLHHANRAALAVGQVGDAQARRLLVALAELVAGRQDT